MRGVGARGGEGAGPPSSVFLRPRACAELICRAFRVASNASRPAAHAALLPPALCEQVPLMAARPAAARSSALSQSIVAKAAAAAAPEAATEAVAHLRFVRGSPLKVSANPSLAHMGLQCGLLAARSSMASPPGTASCSRLNCSQLPQLRWKSLHRASQLHPAHLRRGAAQQEPSHVRASGHHAGLRHISTRFKSWRVWRHRWCPTVCLTKREVRGACRCAVCWTRSAGAAMRRPS